MVSAVSILTTLKFTATQSTFVLTAGPVDVTVIFLSPVEPDDLVKQSLPFAYMAVTAAPNDGKSHAVQLYSDISGEWLGAQDEVINWSTSTGNTLTHQIQLTTQQVNVDSGDRIQRKSTQTFIFHLLNHKQRDLPSTPF